MAALVPQSLMARIHSVPCCPCCASQQAPAQARPPDGALQRQCVSHGLQGQGLPAGDGLVSLWRWSKSKWGSPLSEQTGTGARGLAVVKDFALRAAPVSRTPGGAAQAGAPVRSSSALSHLPSGALTVRAGGLLRLAQVAGLAVVKHV